MLSERKKVCGIDPHKNMCAAVVIKGNPIETLGKIKFENNRRGLDKLLHLLSETDCNTVVIETTNTFWQGISSALMHMGYTVVPVAPQTVPKKREKDDFHDASWLAITYMDNRVTQAYFATPKIQKLRSLLRTRYTLIKIRTMLKNRLNAELSRAGLNLKGVVSDIFGKEGKKILQTLAEEGIEGIKELANSEDGTSHKKNKYAMLLDVLSVAFTENFNAQVITILLLGTDNFEKLIERIEGLVNELIHSDMELLSLVNLLMTIPGVGFITAATIVAEVGDFTRFTSGKKIAKWAGLTPRMRESGGKRYYGRITRRGSPFVRWILYEAATTIAKLKKPQKLYTFYKGIAIRRGTKIAAVALARKLLVVMHAMVMQGRKYDESDAYRGTYERKMYLMELNYKKYREGLNQIKNELSKLRDTELTLIDERQKT